MAHDPVCSGEVDERSPWSSTYQGVTYYFNSAECKANFDKSPGSYVALRSTGTAAAGEGITREEGRSRRRMQEMISNKKDEFAGSIGSVSNAFRTASSRLREDRQDTLAQYLEKIAANVDSVSGYLKEHDAERILHDAEEFVRKRPGLVIGGAITAGFLAVRFLKSSKTISA